jgi:phosphatidylglycerophosphate synthase
MSAPHSNTELFPSPCHRYLGTLQYEIATAFGAFLDPVADKIMVTTALVLLSNNPPAPLSQLQMAVPVIIMCCREVTMSALREWAAAASSSAHKVRGGGVRGRGLGAKRAQHAV